MDNLVSAAWLAENWGRDDIVILDASLHGPVSGGGQYAAGGIPGARRADLDARFCDPEAGLPHMLASPERFAADARALGIRANDSLIVYDRQGIYSSPRLWMTFRAMGHERVAVLDGGLPAWICAGLPVTTADAQPPSDGTFLVRLRSGVICSVVDVLSALTRPDCAVIDARSSARFHGQAPEPRKGLRGGHMPGAFNLPFERVVTAGFLKPAEELAALFRDLVGERRRLIFTCGSGVTACIPALAAQLSGYDDVAVYDGSWAEWGGRDDLPVV